MTRSTSTVSVATGLGHRPGDLLEVDGRWLLVTAVEGRRPATLVVVAPPWWLLLRLRVAAWVRRTVRRVRFAWYDLLDRWEGVEDD